MLIDISIALKEQFIIIQWTNYFDFWSFINLKTSKSPMMIFLNFINFKLYPLQEKIWVYNHPHQPSMEWFITIMTLKKSGNRLLFSFEVFEFLNARDLYLGKKNNIAKKFNIFYVIYLFSIKIETWNTRFIFFIIYALKINERGFLGSSSLLFVLHLCLKNFVFF